MGSCWTIIKNGDFQPTTVFCVHFPSIPTTSIVLYLAFTEKNYDKKNWNLFDFRSEPDPESYPDRIRYSRKRIRIKMKRIRMQVFLVVGPLRSGGPPAPTPTKAWWFMRFWSFFFSLYCDLKKIGIHKVSAKIRQI